MAGCWTRRAIRCLDSMPPGLMPIPSGAANRRDMAAMSVRQWCWAILPGKAWQRHGNQHERGRGARALPAAPRPRERGLARDAGRPLDDGWGDPLSRPEEQTGGSEWVSTL